MSASTRSNRVFDAHLATAYIAGVLTSAEENDVEAHIDECVACRRHLSELALPKAVCRPSRSGTPRQALPGCRQGRRSVAMSSRACWAPGMGVHAARDPELSRRVALKAMRGDFSEAEARIRLLQEAQAMAPHAPECRSRPRRRDARPRAVSGDGAGGRRELAAMARAEAPLAQGASGVRAGRSRPRRGARGGPRAPRLQAEQHPFGFRGTRASDRLRPRMRDVVDYGRAAHAERAFWRRFARDPSDAWGSCLGDAGVHGARAAPRRVGRYAKRPIQLLRGSLRRALWRTSLRKSALLEQLVEAVGAGRIRAAPAGSGIPPRVLKVLQRGMNVESDRRYPSMDALLEDLKRTRMRSGGAAHLQLPRCSPWPGSRSARATGEHHRRQRHVARVRRRCPSSGTAGASKPSRAPSRGQASRMRRTPGRWSRRP